jgi:hypothetical protein
MYCQVIIIVVCAGYVTWMEEPRNTKKKLGGEDGCGNEMWK